LDSLGDPVGPAYGDSINSLWQELYISETNAFSTSAAKTLAVSTDEKSCQAKTMVCTIVTSHALPVASWLDNLRNLQLTSPDLIFGADVVGAAAYQNITKTEVIRSISCFTANTWIQTDRGPQNIDSLAEGVKVLTRTNDSFCQWG